MTQEGTEGHMASTGERTIEAQIRSASKLEPERLPRLRLLGEEWAQSAADALNKDYAAKVAVVLTEVASLTVSDGAGEIDGHAMAAVVRSTKFREIGFAVADARFANVCVEATFGGTGLLEDTVRPMTKLDRQFVQTALTTFVAAGNDPFEPVLPLDVALGDFFFAAMDTEFDELLAPDARAFIEFAFTVSLGRKSSEIRVALPERIFAPHRRKLVAMPEEAPPIADERWAHDIELGLQLADLEVRAILDEQEITLGDVARFQLGQTLVLNATMESLVVIECEETRLFRGRMGTSRDSYVVRVEEKIDPTEEFIDDILCD
ncbi:FliM/FliN family flagellar motor switch protein [Aurantimonas sp. Leaf443]|uniref:FliM/FliN family flagellar motor switch protein n=1 Tax=Aurantimonas sp. Leaf443 TaxID=1736378 RepID=UPI0006F378FD|nr:FliM/FliN family flagellar motor switch protein [Aurantimonas sp. Leaf443]KQT86006.1 hypothetical protein ASG48_05300 [Aurantimonas sp. Leaf443]